MDNLDNKYLDSSEKRWESNKKKAITLPSISSLKPVKLSWNRASKAKLYGVWGKELFTPKKEKCKMQENINIKPHKVII